MPQQSIPSELLQPGVRLPGSICDRHGTILIERGIELTEAHVLLIESVCAEDLVGGPDWPADILRSAGEPVAVQAQTATAIADSPEPTVARPELVAVEALRAGMRLAQDLYDPSGVLLLAAGMRITPRFLALLGKRNITVLHIGQAPIPSPESDEAKPFDFAAISATQAVEMDRTLDTQLRLAPRVHPVRAWRRPRLPLADLYQEAERGLEHHASVSTAIADAAETLIVGGRISARGLGSKLKSFADMVALDFDLLPLIVSMQRTEDEYLFDHCVNTSMMAMSIGAQLGLNHEQLMEVGLGGLLQDIGMLRVPGNIRLAPRSLADDERNEIEKHPCHTLEMLERVPGLPATVRVIGYQTHERQDGSGYPRGSSCNRLHPLSTIVAVADSFAAMTRPRPHRQALMPYEAARKLLLEGNAGRFNLNVVRAFLDTVALFPIGSVVELHNGKHARVLRANNNQHTRPMVELLSQDGKPTGEIADLAKEHDLTVVRAHAYQPASD